MTSRIGTLGILAIGLLVAACSGAGATPSTSVAPASATAKASQALATPSPSATAKATQAPSPTPAPTGSFHLEKTCEGFECTVTKSSLSAIPIGTKISYSGPGMDSLTATITVEGGSATGTCNIANMPGTCTFTPGTGTLAKLPSKIVVTQAGPIWMWDGDLVP